MPANSTTRWLRSLFRFRLRTLLVLMLLVSVACGYLGKHPYRKSIERPIVARIEAAGGEVDYDYQWSVDGRSNHGGVAPGPPLIRRLLGEDLFASVAHVMLPPTASDDDLQLACQLPELKGVILYGQGFTEDPASALAQATQLELLELHRRNLSPAGLLQLRNLPRLKHIRLFEGTSTGHVQAAAQLPQLETLRIVRSNTNGTGIASLRDATKLERLEIYQCPNLNDAALHSLRNLRSLRFLYINDSTATGAALEAIGELPLLEELDIALLPLNDAQAQHLSKLSQLQVLNAAGTNLGDEGLAAIAQLQNLRSLKVGGTRITDASATTLDTLRDLEYLDIYETNITDEGLGKLKPLLKLAYIKFDLDRGITVEGGRKFQLAHPKCVVECIQHFPDGTGAWIDVMTGEIKVD
jgi:hypothetical protein